MAGVRAMEPTVDATFHNTNRSGAFSGGIVSVANDGTSKATESPGDDAKSAILGADG